MRRLRPLLIGLATYLTLVSGGVLFLLASLGGISGQGFWLQTKSIGGLLPGVPGFLMALAFLCLSLACFVPLAVLLVHRRSGGAGVSALLVIVAFGLAFVALGIDLLPLWGPS
jgi:hypothetical protein